MLLTFLHYVLLTIYQHLCSAYKYINFITDISAYKQIMVRVYNLHMN